MADFANSLPEAQFYQQPAGKWSVADTIHHLFLSARPVVRLMAASREVFQQWGQPDDPSRSYDEMAEAYRQALSRGVKAPAAMSPQPEDVNIGRSAVMERFMHIYDTLATTADTWSADDLDRYRMPHPALGNITVREMLDFTDIHTLHHLHILQEQQP